MKVSLALFAVVLVASVGMISSGGVFPQFTDASILQDIGRQAEVPPRGEINPEISRIRFEIITRLAITRGFIPTYIDERQLAIPRGSRCMRFNTLRLSLILTPDNAIIAVPNGRYDCPVPEEDAQLFRAINSNVILTSFQRILNTIPSAFPAYI